MQVKEVASHRRPLGRGDVRAAEADAGRRFGRPHESGLQDRADRALAAQFLARPSQPRGGHESQRSGKRESGDGKEDASQERSLRAPLCVGAADGEVGVDARTEPSKLVHQVLAGVRERFCALGSTLGKAGTGDARKPISMDGFRLVQQRDVVTAGVHAVQGGLLCPDDAADSRLGFPVGLKKGSVSIDHIAAHAGLFVDLQFEQARCGHAQIPERFDS